MFNEGLSWMVGKGALVCILLRRTKNGIWYFMHGAGKDHLRFDTRAEGQLSSSTECSITLPYIDTMRLSPLSHRIACTFFLTKTSAVHCAQPLM